MLLNPDPTSRWKPSMRTHLTALCVLGAALVSACGDGNDGAVPDAGVLNAGAPDAGVLNAGAPDAGPPATPPPPSEPPVASQLDGAALRLYESAAVHAFLTAAPLVYAVFDDHSVWSGPCALGYGSLQGSIDGSPAARGTVLPTGSHTYVVTFADCTVDGLVGIALNGTASAAYTSTDLNDIELTETSAVRLRAWGSWGYPAFRSDLYDVTVDGSGTWTRVRTGAPTSSSTASSTIYTPTIGSTLVNNSTSNVATFTGGSYSSSYGSPPPGSSGSGQEEFNNLTIVISGTSYALNGSLHWVYGSPCCLELSRTGEVRITSNGILMARIYGDGSGTLRTEVLGPLVPF
jgi:hypothetical protein